MNCAISGLATMAACAAGGAVCCNNLWRRKAGDAATLFLEQYDDAALMAALKVGNKDVV